MSDFIVFGQNDEFMDTVARPDPEPIFLALDPLEQGQFSVLFLCDSSAPHAEQPALSVCFQLQQIIVISSSFGTGGG